MRSLLATSSLARFRPLPVVALVLAATGCSPKAGEPKLALPVGTTPIPPVAAPAVEFDDADPSALALFRPELSPYGAWVDDPVAGTVFVIAWAGDVVGSASSARLSPRLTRPRSPVLWRRFHQSGAHALEL